MPSPLEGLFEIESIVGADFQTAIPEAVRRALGLKPGDRLRYRIDNDGRIHLENRNRTVAVPRSAPSLSTLATALMSGEPNAAAGLASTLDPALISSLQDLMKNAPSLMARQAKADGETD